MSDTTFHIYRSSAGSGKTRTLAKEYLKLALRYPEYFRYILAMTFTNKSTQEMKDRIIRYLDDFTHGRSDDLAAEILKDFAADGKLFTPLQFKERSREVLSLILHQYSQFAVSTIDAFFQRVIRSFTRETGLLGNFRLEVDNDMVLEDVIDRVMDNLTDNEELRGWVLEFSLERLESGKDWDIRSALLEFAKEIFREDFKKIEEDVLRATADKRFFQELRQRLQAVVRQFEQQVNGEAAALLDSFHQHGLVVTDFKYGASGSVYGYVSTLATEITLPGKRVREALEDPAQWAATKSERASLIITQAAAQWIPRLTGIVTYMEANSETYYSAEQALRNLYVFGLLSDISKTLREYLQENNMMLLSDAPQFLRGVMQDQDASFLYEKVGSFYRHFLIDEFQDTSGFQWHNVLPLVRNGIAQNYRSLIVGDIKQSIYRWRGGDLNILQEQVVHDIGAAMTQTYHLDTNYRSTGHVVTFNNAIFEAAAALISKETGSAFPAASYADAAQKTFREAGKGYVHLQFVKTSELEENTTFHDASLQMLPPLVETLQEKGVALRNIAFLVRDNSEGQMIAQHFMQYRTTASLKPGCRYDVVSNESLRLDQAASVVVLINALRLLEDPKNQIASAQLAYEYQKLWPVQAFPNQHKVFMQSKTKEFARQVPASFTQQADILAALPLVELVETLIHMFNLGKLATEIAYLQGFQDVVLEFAMREKSDLASFLQWWEDNRHKKSVQVAGGVDAAQIITIHKSKGLQFEYVIVPFLSWELNHPGHKAPILWCQASREIFQGAGYLPLRYNTKLEHTYFRDAYVTERQRIYLDNLNLLYVAFTRAETGLIAHAPLSRQRNLSHVGSLVRWAIDQDISLQESWSEEKQSLTIGEITTPPASGEKQQEALLLKQYRVAPWRERLTVRARGKEFFRQTEQRQKINYGIFIHALMARVRTAADVATVMEQALREGMIHPDECASVEEAVRWIVAHPMLTMGFQDIGTLKTEASLIMPDGSERRIDRIVLDEGQALLMDYKTGAPAPADHTQVKEYLAILSSMGVSGARGFLVYIDERQCVEVK